VKLGYQILKEDYYSKKNYQILINNHTWFKGKDMTNMEKMTPPPIMTNFIGELRNTLPTLSMEEFDTIVCSIYDTTFDEVSRSMRMDTGFLDNDLFFSAMSINGVINRIPPPVIDYISQLYLDVVIEVGIVFGRLLSSRTVEVVYLNESCLTIRYNKQVGNIKMQEIMV
jgi:hypothetical protein